MSTVQWPADVVAAERHLWYCCAMTALRTFFLVVFLVLPALTARAEAGDEDFDRGYSAFAARDYANAAKWWKLAAEQGHARAQNGLGVLFRDGDLGVADKTQAAYWFKRSAENGYAFAMYSLALLYRDGDGVARDDIEAHKWFNLASSINFDPKAAFQRDLIAQRMSREDISEAEKRAQEWLNKFFFGNSSA